MEGGSGPLTFVRGVGKKVGGPLVAEGFDEEKAVDEEASVRCRAGAPSMPPWGSFYRRGETREAAAHLLFLLPFPLPGRSTQPWADGRVKRRTSPDRDVFLYRKTDTDSYTRTPLTPPSSQRLPSP
jgi:hypothetical protein